MHRRRFLAQALGLSAMPLVARAAVRPTASRYPLCLANAHTGETFQGTYRNDAGPIPAVMDELSVFLRDHHSGEKVAIDVGVLDILSDIMDSIGAAKATVLSAYRNPETNAMLARTTFGVAENSQHLYGRALDIRFGSKLMEAMVAAQEMKRGGVGWYPYSGFIHIDTGPVRNWTLDEHGLDDLLLFDGRHLRIGGKGGVMLGGKSQGMPRRPGRPLRVRQRLQRPDPLSPAA